MSGNTLVIPNPDDLRSGESRVHILHEGGDWRAGAIMVVDLAPGAQYRHESLKPVFIHQVRGTASGRPAESCQVAVGGLILSNYSPEVSRTLLCEVDADPSGLVAIADVPILERPFGIRLQSLLAECSPRAAQGYEFVEIPGGTTVQAHTHGSSNAVVLVLVGTGYAARRVGGEEVIDALEPGSVVYFPAGIPHGFYSNGFIIISVQDRGIEGDYQLAEDFNYPMHI